LIDKKPGALAGALSEIEKFKNTVGKEAGHKGGIVTTFNSDELQHALKGAWLAIEVGDNWKDFIQHGSLLTDY